MRTGEPRRTSLILNLLIAAMLIMLFAPVYVVKADDGHGHHHDDDVTIDNVLTGGDAVSGGNELSTRGGISVGGSDMEISDSLATHSILFGLWQGTHTNPYAEADGLDARGNYKAAAEMRCSTKKYRKVYKDNCIESVIYTPPVDVPRETTEPDDLYEAVYARLMDLEAQRTVDVANTQKAVQRANAAVEKANKAESAQRAYAQQALEELKEWN